MFAQVIRRTTWITLCLLMLVNVSVSGAGHQKIIPPPPKDDYDSGIPGDKNGNGIPDYEEDANHNGIPDFEEDLNNNGIPDFEEDMNHNGIPDLEEDLNHNGIPDFEEDGIEDKNHNGIPDDEEIPENQLAPRPAKTTIWSKPSYFPGDWHDKRNWSKGVPKENRALIDRAGVVHIRSSKTGSADDYRTEDVDVQVGYAHDALVHHITGAIGFRSIEIAELARSTAEYILSDSARLHTAYVTVGERGRGYFNQEGGEHDIRISLRIAMRSGSSGTYALSGNAKCTTKRLVVGYAGEGVLDQTGGTLEVANMCVGYAGRGEYRLGGGGKLKAKQMHVGKECTAVVNQTGGHAEIGKLTLYPNATYNLKGGDITTNDLVISTRALLDIFCLESVTISLQGDRRKDLAEMIRKGLIYIGPCEYEITYSKNNKRTTLVKHSYKFSDDTSEPLRHTRVDLEHKPPKVEDIPRQTIREQFSGRRIIENSQIIEAGYNLLLEGRLETAKATYIGPQNAARFNNCQGKHKCGIMLWLGPGSFYNLGGEGYLETGCVEYLEGSVSQSRGIHTVGGAMFFEGEFFRMSGPSTLSPRNAFYIASGSTFEQASGTCEMKGTMFISGTYNLYTDASLKADSIIIRSKNTPAPTRYQPRTNQKKTFVEADFTQTGGSVIAASLNIGSGALYRMKRGSVALMNLSLHGSLEIDILAIESFKVLGNHTERLNAYIAEGRIFDPTLYGAGLKAVFTNNATYLEINYERLDSGIRKYWNLKKNQPDYWHDETRYKKWHTEPAKQTVSIDRDACVIIAAPPPSISSTSKSAGRIAATSFRNPILNSMRARSTWGLTITNAPRT